MAIRRVKSDLVKNIVQEFQEQSPASDVMNAKGRLAKRLQEIAKQDYEILSRGGMTQEGHYWEETQDSRLHGGLILVDSGNMFRSLYAEWNGGVLSVRFDLSEAPYAGFAAAKRPLFAPGRIPRRWVAEIRISLIQELLLLIRTRLHGK